MAKKQKKNLNTSPDDTRTFEKGKIELKPSTAYHVKPGLN